MDKYFNFSRNDFVIDNLESNKFVERNEPEQEVVGNLTIEGTLEVEGNSIIENLNVTNTLTANTMVTNGDISTEDGLIEHLKIVGEEPVNNKNFGDYAEYKIDGETNGKFKGYSIGKGSDRLYIF
ncbi:MAG: hypothetical protein GY739_01690, partial [Mesoflavibacter sp.]|nr:hypothetical protein [Mesoflavibacter sp.]